ncbi:MAG: hypothetical protein WBC44_03775 [Planctomycetaceae bacterium]
MAVTVELLGQSGNHSESPSRMRRYFVRGATDESDALVALLASVPAIHASGLVLRTVSVDEKVVGGFECEAQYGVFQKKDPPQKGESQFNFEVSAQPVKVYVPLEPQTVYTAPGLTPPQASDVAGWLIGDQGDGKGPEGVEVYEPVASFSETHYLDATGLTPLYRATVLYLVGKTNNAAFKGFAAGEVLCQSISGSRRASDDWEISFRFSVRQNQTGLTIAGVTGINKQGWQYLWPRYELKKDAGAKQLTNKVTHIVVADVFKPGNFSALGIGT